MNIKNSVFWLLLPLILFISCEDESVVLKNATSDLHFITQSDVEGNYVVMDSIIGQAAFFEEDGIVNATFTLEGFPPNSSHGLHIHEGTCESPGGHWNQGNSFAYCQTLSMDQPWGKPYVGDIGNIRTDENGTGSLTLETDLWSVNTGDVTDILGKIIVIHNHAEDFIWQCRNNTLPPMHNNPKVGCGTIVLTARD